MVDVYVDVLLVLNVWVDYMILLATAKFSGLYGKRKRMVLSACLGGLYAVLMFFWQPGSVMSVLLQVFVSPFFLLLAFGKQEKMGKMISVFFAVSFSFAGGVMLLHQMGSGAKMLQSGVFYLDVSLFEVVLAVGGCYVLVGLVLRKFGKHTGRELAHICMFFRSHRIEFDALVDSGNDLTDPVTGKSILIVEKKIAARLLPASSTQAIFALTADNCTEVLERLSKEPYGQRFGLVSYRALGVEHGLLLTFRPDGILKNDRPFEALIAISPSGVSAGAYHALVSP